MLKSRARDETWIDMDTKAKLGTAAIGTQSVKVHIDPIVAGFGIGMRFRPPSRPGPAGPAAPPWPPTHSCALIVVVDKDSLRRAVEIVELTAPRRPEEGGQPEEPEPERDRQEQEQAAHRAAPRSRKALATTRIELPDMASAAISGVTLPAIASGTASTL